MEIHGGIEREAVRVEGKEERKGERDRARGGRKEEREGDGLNGTSGRAS